MAYYSVKCRNDAEQYYHRARPRNSTPQAINAFKAAASASYRAAHGAAPSRQTNFEANRAQPHIIL